MIVHESFYSFTQGSTNFITLVLKIGFHQLESSLASHSITNFQIKKRKKSYKRLIFVADSPKEELQHALRDIFPGIKRVANIADDILINF